MVKKIVLPFWEVVEVAFIAAVSVFLIRTFLIQPFLVSGASMEPNFQSGNYLLIDEITYRFREPKRGEVVVFRYPLDHSVFFIKRIIGMPGERVASQRGEIRIYTDGIVIMLNESYLEERGGAGGNFDITLGADQYFALGDNRDHSFDSRNWGAIRRSDIVGLTRMRILPIQNIGIFEAPIY